MNTRGVERERKFLVNETDFLHGHRPTAIAQTYLVANEDVELRLRVFGSTAVMTLKSGAPDLVRSEEEWVVSSTDLVPALLFSTEMRIAKDRYSLAVGEHVWSVDVFQDRNEGLTLAEVEFNEGDSILLPAWCGQEVTGDERYYNRSLAMNPWPTWHGDST